MNASETLHHPSMHLHGALTRGLSWVNRLVQVGDFAAFIDEKGGLMKAWMSGSVAGTGTFRCTDCDYPVSLDAVDELPTCPNCGGTEFVRASLFTTAQTSVLEVAADDDDQGWLDELRGSLSEPGQYLAYRS